jgi:signal transduction histidine kinase
MFIGVKTKILLTVLAIVLLFTVFSLFYFPTLQRKILLTNYKSEIQNQAKTIALGASIALSEQNFKGLKTAMDFVKENEELKFVTLIQKDTIWNPDSIGYKIEDKVVVSYPEDQPLGIELATSDSLIIMKAPFRTNIMDGEIMLGVSTNSINVRQRKIQITALLISAAIFLVGMLIGLWLSRSISKPVIALHKAAKRVGEGDLSSEVKSSSKDEIGELAIAFNNMVKDIKKLSDLTLEQEKEKQQLLASQNEALEKQVEERTRELNQSLVDLKDAQVQLIQSEKMASLGELTAGIAHEIQNPLNFVNNFSELNTELLQELLEELAFGNTDNIKPIITDLIENEKKIAHHGKRADAIVKGMLQHSSRSSGVKEPTDINVLTDEYLRLALHGIRAKDKSFNATIKKDFDGSLSADEAGIGTINIIPQDIGKVIHNLLLNAFYAVTEKKKLAGDEYEPTVSVSTKKTDDKVQIKVKDNGNGVPQKIVDKIFQPFFTTKPTGQGTGLGLSLSYEIIKAHGGELKVEGNEEEGAEFLIVLPV